MPASPRPDSVPSCGPAVGKPPWRFSARQARLSAGAPAHVPAPVMAVRALHAARRSIIFSGARNSCRRPSTPLVTAATTLRKTMGIIAVLLYSQGHLGAVISTFRSGWCSPVRLPWPWGRLVGGWRIVRTMGSKITRLTPMQGFCAETGGSITLFAATWLGVPVSTTHTITGSIIGVGAAKQDVAPCDGSWRAKSSTAWIVTIPASAAIAVAFSTG